MKRTLKFSAVALLAVLVLWACGGASGPKEVGEKFLAAISKGDVEGAKKFATKDAQASLDMAATTLEAKKTTPDKIEIGTIKEDGDKATLSYKENGADKTLELMKEGGEWKAAWSKGAGDSGMDKLGEELGGAMEGAMEGATEGGDSAATEAPAGE
jgi:hypothetical protein